jgi:hypothetical protein
MGFSLNTIKGGAKLSFSRAISDLRTGVKNGINQKARQEQRAKESPTSDNKTAAAPNQRLWQIKAAREISIDCGGAA